MSSSIMTQESHRTYIDQPKKKIFHPEEARRKKAAKGPKKPNAFKRVFSKKKPAQGLMYSLDDDL
eukprot:CAMPEP_0168529086 /NCGR_PEP_ID=MMETSP0405-20121227/13680_1 /TAXON_ID=498012 /ORGANISM="Trichosphaerium sp, Strain Am-I-7 wt" /LENGTH=64 /DNA_ID=CAMNT_0008552705 /DNA_START=41 /DNA_END=235 /DNA_ORIENTATION=-